MRTLLTLAFSLALVACGGASKPAPTPTTPTPTESGDTCGVQSSNGMPTNAEQCECLGFTVHGDIGDGNVACAEGETEVARISYGIEGGVCCKPAAAAMTGEPATTLP